MSLADYHTHTPLCRHAEGSPEVMVAAARAAGLAEYGISDHCPWTEELDDWRMDRSEWSAYLEWVEHARRAGGLELPVRLGLEVDWLVGGESWLRELAGWAEFDYWIGAVHYLEPGWAFDNPAQARRLEEIGAEQAWQRYFKLYEEMVRSGLFQIAAHPDLIKKFGTQVEGDRSRFYDPVVRALAETGTAVEINTAGWHKPCAEAYPTLEFLRKTRAAGVGLVISSDAHAPDQLGRDFGRALDLAREAGYEKTLRFEKGRSREVAL